MSEQFYLTELTEHDAEQLCKWVYPVPYDLYDWADWEDMVRNHSDLADDTVRQEQYRALYHYQYGLCGFVQFFRMENVIRLGVGLRPDCCGCGYGKLLMKLAIEEASRMAIHSEIDLEVHAWNARALRVYEQAGFQISDTYSRQTARGLETFHCLVYQPN